MPTSEDAVQRGIDENLPSVDDSLIDEFSKKFFLQRLPFQKSTNFTRSKIPAVCSTQGGQKEDESTQFHGQHDFYSERGAPGTNFSRKRGSKFGEAISRNHFR